MTSRAGEAKIVNGRSVVISLPTAIAIIITLIAMVAGYFATYSDLRAEVVSNRERTQAQEKFFSKEFERIYLELTEIKKLLRER